jgi:hypothetical protein
MDLTTCGQRQMPMYGTVTSRSVALVQFVVSDLARSQRWVPPVLAYGLWCWVDVAIGGGTARNSLPTFATNAAFLFPIAVWLTVVAGNCEDPVQTAITVATVGSETRVRLAKLTVAFAACIPLSLFAVVLAWAATGLPDAALTAEGLTAHLIAAAGGVAVGAWLIRPLLDRRVWIILAGLMATLTEVTVPHLPPVRQLLVLLEADRPTQVPRHLAEIAIETMVILSLLVGLSLPVGRART